MNTRVLGVDPGEKRIGVAISDTTAAIARPLTVLAHTSRAVDAAAIAGLAAEHQASTIVVGQSLDEDGRPNVSGRRAARLAAAIHQQTTLPVVLWPEDFSTVSARARLHASGAPRRKRARPVDDMAAAAILQDYLDHSRQGTSR
jgi:putative Holliday junction resolvase